MVIGYSLDIIELGQIVSHSENFTGFLSLAVYLASGFTLVCTLSGVNVMDISTMIDWCGTALRVSLKHHQT